ncbi:hypothetical protein [Aliiroseovarius lamellibrachiae]|uniref:hypothetical protein n=1 Tax=Aliiroseovarius lamellibrachiae TaxID=1924933 RepID=UPI001BE02DD3|nr:hypothetical protein [Aliiroseovarius lamellibrachiae]MBT2129545.1 hypothetical protein [Aliiroseovarius lamellibrachiae]
MSDVRTLIYPPRPKNPMAQVIEALVERHGRWRVLRAALFAGHPTPLRKRRRKVPKNLHRDVGLTDTTPKARKEKLPTRDIIL